MALSPIVPAPSAGSFKYESSRLRTVAALTPSDGRPVTLLCILNTFVEPPRLLTNGSVLTLLSVVDPSSTDTEAPKRDLLMSIFQNEQSAAPPRPLCPGDLLLLEGVQLTEFRHADSQQLTTRGRFNKMRCLAVHSGELTAPAPQHPSTKELAADVATLRQWWHESKTGVRRLLAAEANEMNLEPKSGKRDGVALWVALVKPPNGVEPDYPYPTYQPATDATFDRITEPGAYNVICKVIQVRRVWSDDRFDLAISVTDGGVLCSPLRGQAAVAPSGNSCPQTMVLRIPRPLLWHAQFLVDDDNITLRNLLVCPTEEGKLRAHLESPHAALVWFMKPGEQPLHVTVGPHDMDTGNGRRYTTARQYLIRIAKKTTTETDLALERRIAKATSSCCQ